MASSGEIRIYGWTRCQPTGWRSVWESVNGKNVVVDEVTRSAQLPPSRAHLFEQTAVELTKHVHEIRPQCHFMTCTERSGLKQDLGEQGEGPAACEFEEC